MAARQYPSIEYVNQALIYGHGSLFWKERPKDHFASDRTWKMWNTRYAGTEAGHQHFYENRWRWIVCLSDKHIKRSVVVWAMHNQQWPPFPLEVDHIDNTNPLDDRVENLRLATHSQNGANKTKPSNNTSGFKGVSWHTQAARWRANIVVNGRSIHLGLFDDIADAHAAYCAAAIKHFGPYASFE